MKVSYYPGCSLESSAKEYQISANAVCEKLDIELVEIEDWNCCGALEVSSLNPLLSLALPARNLKIASEESDKLVVTCNACLNNLVKVQWKLFNNGGLKDKINKLLNYEFREIEIKHLLDLIVNGIGLEKVKERVQKPLNGLKTVSYYGCLIVRPSKILNFDDPDDPESLDKLVLSLGGAPLEFFGKTKCCGGGLLMTHENVAFELTKEIIAEAEERGAQCITVTCPLCHMALESLQHKILAKIDRKREIPVLYFTQLMGLSFGIPPKELGLHKNMISTKSVIDFVK
jgi:heterodisulfide reductase subunit B